MLTFEIHDWKYRIVASHIDVSAVGQLSVFLQISNSPAICAYLILYFL